MWQFDFFKAAPGHSTVRKGRRSPKNPPELPSVLVKKSEGVNVDIRNLYFPHRDGRVCSFSMVNVYKLSVGPLSFLYSLGNSSKRQQNISLVASTKTPRKLQSLSGYCIAFVNTCIFLLYRSAILTTLRVEDMAVSLFLQSGCE